MMSHAANPYLVDPAGARSPEPAVEVPVGVVTAPQPYGRVPVRARLGVEAVDGTFELYVVGAHGGAGESVLAELGGSGWRAMQHRWPHVPDRRVSPRGSRNRLMKVSTNCRPPGCISPT